MKGSKTINMCLLRDLKKMKESTEEIENKGH